MRRLRIKLLGGYAVLDDIAGEVAPPARKAQALLAILALSAGQWHGRDRLAGLLWSDRQEARSRNRLRQAMASIRNLGESLGIDLIETDGDRVQLRDGVAETDAAAFQKLGADDPIAATDLYAGDLLDGFMAPDAAFQDWLSGERAALREIACETFQRAIARAEDNGDRPKAVKLAKRLVGLDPYRESGHRRLMELHAAAGDRAEAIRQYRACERLLRDELDVAPAQETTRLLEKIRIGGRAAGADKIASALRPPLPGRPSIAVLPFDNLSGEPEHEFFADGMAEDIIAGLSKFRWLFVIARNSSFTYKGRAVDVRRVARELGVRYVMEGSIRKGGDRIRVAARLIDALAGNPIWSERYDRRLEDLFALQDEITATLVGAIAPEIDQAERQRAERYTPDGVDTWLMFQKGLTAYYETTEDSLKAAVEILDEVCRRDPRFPRRMPSPPMRGTDNQSISMYNGGRNYWPWPASSRARPRSWIAATPSATASMPGCARFRAIMTERYASRNRASTSIRMIGWRITRWDTCSSSVAASMPGSKPWMRPSASARTARFRLAF